MHRILVDTNTLVSYAIGEEPACSDYKRLLGYAIDGKIALYASSHSLKDVYYIIAARLKALEMQAVGTVTESAAAAAKEAAWASVELLGRQLIIVPMGQSEHDRAFVYRSLHDDYEDDLQLAAAHTAGADLLVTNDRSLKGHSPIAALSSAEAAAFLEAELAIC